MEQAATIADFKKDPIGRWVLVGPGVVWCASPALSGCVFWGKPSRADAERTVEAFDNFDHPSLAPRYDLLLDARRIEAIDPLAFAALVRWVADRRAQLAK